MMTEDLAISRVDTTRFACDGSGESGADKIHPALGHPRVWLEVDPKAGSVTCGYCDRHFILIGGVADPLKAGHEI